MSKENVSDTPERLRASAPLFLVVFVWFVCLCPVPIFGALSSWLYFLLVAILCLLPNAAVEVWYKLYMPAAYQTLQHIPAEMVAAREEAERKAVEDAIIAKEEAAKAAKEAVAASKALAAGRRRRTRASMGGGDMSILSAIQPGGAASSRAVGGGASSVTALTFTTFGAASPWGGGGGTAPPSLHPSPNPLHPHTQTHAHKPLHLRIGDATPRAPNE